MHEMKVGDLLKNKYATIDKPEYYAIVINVTPSIYEVEWLDKNNITRHKLSEFRKHFIFVS